ncbi:hypothetical protein SLEP1_g1684 [Rubroshorea leprosula]|uniref:Legume lectin domain-containing protein n=1 Tax=Rubroshorea leprosula TaxID=152421 RepID=A0AAV5HEK6_9ROSI|nr:hypothetical protein SLEP1_g1684 [Rubroshorea leprosula]
MGLVKAGNGYLSLTSEPDNLTSPPSSTGSYLGIMDPSTEARSLNYTGIDPKSGIEIQVKIYYNGFKKKLQIYAAYSGKPLQSILNQSIDMSDLIPSSVYVGFTASTGKATAESHQVIDWIFTTTPLSHLNSNNAMRKKEMVRKKADIESRSRTAANLSKGFLQPESKVKRRLRRDLYHRPPKAQEHSAAARMVPRRQKPPLSL